MHLQFVSDNLLWNRMPPVAICARKKAFETGLEMQSERTKDGEKKCVTELQFKTYLSFLKCTKTNKCLIPSNVQSCPSYLTLIVHFHAFLGKFHKYFTEHIKQYWFTHIHSYQEQQKIQAAMRSQRFPSEICGLKCQKSEIRSTLSLKTTKRNRAAPSGRFCGFYVIKWSFFLWWLQIKAKDVCF